MATSGYGAAADHAALTGLTVGDPHSQYAYTGQGTLAQRPMQPVRAGYHFWATDAAVLYRSDGAAWSVVGTDTNSYPTTRQFARLFLFGGR